MRMSQWAARDWLPYGRGTSRLLTAASVVMLIELIWFAVNLHGRVGHPVLLWLTGPVATSLMAAGLLQVSRISALAPPLRRFWRHLGTASVLITVACLFQIVDVLRRPDVGGLRNTSSALTFYGLALVILVVNVSRLPLKEGTRGEMLRIGLDAGTVMLASAAFLWHFQDRSMSSAQGSVFATSAVLVTLGLVAVFTVTRMALSDYQLIDKASLRLLALAMLVGSLLPLVLGRVLPASSDLTVVQLNLPIVAVLGLAAAEQQRRARPLQRGARPRRGVRKTRRRSFSLLPYVAVAAVDGLLLWVTWSPDADDRSLIVLTVVLLTGLVALRQITALRDNGHLLARLDYGATHDALTALPNRVLFGQRLHKALTSPGERPVSVALIDLDDFKEVNDTLGHEIGDLLLVAVAKRLAGCIRIEDTVARLGGDEFVVVLDGADPTAAGLAAERMMVALRDPILADGHELPIRASIGIANGHTGDEASVLLRHADNAMYAATNLSGTAYLHYDGSMRAAVNHAHLGGELREAIAAGQLHLLYQPIVALADGTLAGAEALVRWDHPVRGTLEPGSFIPVAERTGLIVPLGTWVLNEACRQLAAWIAEHGDAAPARLNVNISGRDLREPDFATAAAAVLSEHGVPGSRLVLEVTETMALELGASVINLHRLRELGIQVSLDDFGTGHSTLSLLHDCPVDEIKLDRSFVQAEADGRPSVAAAVLLLARAMDLHAVAEGVETAEQAELLRQLGYPAAQGFYFAPPMPPEAFAAVLRERRRNAMVPANAG